MDNERIARELVRIAGQILGPGKPDGSGPVGLGRKQRKRQQECPFEDEEVEDEE